MKLYETILFALTLALLVIGLHQTAVNGFVNSYWIFMLMIIMMIIYRIRKNKQLQKGEVDKKDDLIQKPLRKSKGRGKRR